MIKPLYKAQEPFMEVKNGFGYQGVVMYDDVSDKVQCHICGKWFSLCSQHIRKTHKINSDDYKIEYGLSLRTALCSKNISRKHSITALRMYPTNMGLMNSLNTKKPNRTHKPKAPKQYYNQTMQAKNGRGLCDLQTIGRYEVVKECVGESQFIVIT